MATNPLEEASLLQFAPFISRIDTGFWHKLGIFKLDVFKLDENAKRIHGYYRNGKAKQSVGKLLVRIQYRLDCTLVAFFNFVSLFKTF